MQGPTGSQAETETRCGGRPRREPASPLRPASGLFQPLLPSPVFAPQGAEDQCPRRYVPLDTGSGRGDSGPRPSCKGQRGAPSAWRPAACSGCSCCLLATGRPSLRCPELPAAGPRARTSSWLQRKSRKSNAEPSKFMFYFHLQTTERVKLGTFIYLSG